MRTRTTLFACLAAGAALFASTAHAAPASVVTDARGDALGAQTAYDIVSVTAETTRASKARNAPLKDLVVTIEMAAAPKFDPGSSYNLSATTPSCGTMFIYAWWEVESAGPLGGMQFSECGPDGATGSTFFVETDPTVEIKGNTVKLTISTKALPTQVKAGQSWTEFFAYTAPAEPFGGLTTVDETPDELDETVAWDVASGSKAWKYGS